MITGGASKVLIIFRSEFYELLITALSDFMAITAKPTPTNKFSGKN